MNLGKAVFRQFSTTAIRRNELEVSYVGSHVAHVKLNRPDRRNTFTMELWRYALCLFYFILLFFTSKAVNISKDENSLGFNLILKHFK